MSIVTEWEIKTMAVRPRSAELKKLDAAVKTWATRGQGIKDVNMQAVWTELQAWRTGKSAEYAKIKALADELELELGAKWKAMPKTGLTTGASLVKPIGWALGAALNPITYGDVLMGANLVGALTTTEIVRVNEAMSRVKQAVKHARDAIVKVAQRKQFTGIVPVEERAYLDFFGPFNVDRLNAIVANFQALALAFDGTTTIYDVRNWTLWGFTYGGCVRANLVNKATGTGIVSLTGSVEMLMGRSFLLAGSYAKTTDSTVGTLVHEFSHGTVNAVDVPDIDAGGNFMCGRASDDPKHADFGNSVDPHNHQCSTEALDMLLARLKPDYALVNADNYGQFTRRILANIAG